MKKIVYLLTSCLLLAGCDHGSTSGTSIQPQTKIIDVTSIDLAVDETYNLYLMVSEAYKNQLLTIEMKNNNYLIADSDLGILRGKAIGDVTLKVVSGDAYQNIDVHVRSDEYVNAHFVVDKGRLWNKKAVFLGDSITDINVRQHSYDYYPNLIQKWAQMSSIENYAMWGATAGPCEAKVNWQQTNDGKFGVDQVHEAIDANTLQEADYAFIFLGTNDFMSWVPLGSKNDLPATREEKMTFMGGLNYMYTHILECNSKIRIVAIEIPYAQWSKDGSDNTYYGTPGCGETRNDYSEKIKEIATHHGFISIPTWDLWNASNWSTYISDGIHPDEEGHILLAKRILNQI